MLPNVFLAPVGSCEPKKSIDSITTQNIIVATKGCALALFRPANVSFCHKAIEAFFELTFYYFK